MCKHVWPIKDHSDLLLSISGVEFVPLNLAQFALQWLKWAAGVQLDMQVKDNCAKLNLTVTMFKNIGLHWNIFLSRSSAIHCLILSNYRMLVTVSSMEMFKSKLKTCLFLLSYNWVIVHYISVSRFLHRLHSPSFLYPGRRTKAP